MSILQGVYGGDASPALECEVFAEIRSKHFGDGIGMADLVTTRVKELLAFIADTAIFDDATTHRLKKTEQSDSDDEDREAVPTALVVYVYLVLIRGDGLVTNGVNLGAVPEASRLYMHLHVATTAPKRHLPAVTTGAKITLSAPML